jgi:hypothetical protein
MLQCFCFVLKDGVMCNLSLQQTCRLLCLLPVAWCACCGLHALPAALCVMCSAITCLHVAATSSTMCLALVLCVVCMTCSDCLTPGCAAAAAAGCALQSTLLPASTLTMVSIVTCMKLCTYAHCNFELRAHARKRALAEATPDNAAAAAAAFADAPAASTDTPFASIPAPELVPSNPQPGSESGSGLASGFVAYPLNLKVADVAYYMLAPTLTYQLNFPRMKRRRVRLLRRWVSLLLGTLLLMSFMQVRNIGVFLFRV